METKFRECFIAQADEIGRRIRTLNEHRVTRRIEGELKTIDIRVEQSAEALAAELLQQKLKDSAQWVDLEKQQQKLQQQKWSNWKSRLLWFPRWIGSGWSGWGFYLMTVLTSGMIGGIMLINMPSSMVCPSQQSLCFVLRWDKSTVILPEQREKILQRYLENHSKSQSRKKQRLRKGR